MHFLITLVASVFVFGLALLFHEAGHFATAKKCGIQVNEFSIGMGPALFSRVHGGTRYSLRLLPIGGYVSMEGEDGEVDPDERPEGASGLPFGKVSIPRRVLVVAAGALMNFVLGFLVLLILIWLWDSWGFAIGVIGVVALIASTKTVVGKGYLYPLIPFNGKKLMRLLRRRPINKDNT